MASPEGYNERRVEWLSNQVYSAKEKIPFIAISPELAERVGYWLKRKEDLSFSHELYTPRIIEGGLNIIRAHARINGRNKANIQDFEYMEGVLNKFLF